MSPTENSGNLRFVGYNQEENLKSKLLLIILALLVIFQGYRGFTFENPALPPGRTNQLLFHDVRYFYIMGKCLISGSNPYLPEEYTRMWDQELTQKFNSPAPQVALVYPPTLALIAIPIAFFNWENATRVFDFLNYASFILSLFFTAGILSAIFQRSPTSSRILFGLILGASSSSITMALHTGQTPLFATAGILGTLYFALCNRPNIATIFLILASVKPQISLLPLLVIFVARPSLIWRGTVAVGLFSVLVLLPGLSGETFAGLTNSFSDYVDKDPLRIYKVNIMTRLLWVSGLNYLRLPMLLAGMAIALYYSKILGVFSFQKLDESRFSQRIALIVPFFLNIIFMPLHPYDYCMLFPFYGVFGQLKAKYLLLSSPLLLLFLRPNFFQILLSTIQVEISHFMKPNDLMVVVATVASILPVLLLIHSKILDNPGKIFALAKK